MDTLIIKIEDFQYQQYVNVLATGLCKNGIVTKTLIVVTTITDTSTVSNIILSFEKNNSYKDTFVINDLQKAINAYNAE